MFKLSRQQFNLLRVYRKEIENRSQITKDL